MGKRARSEDDENCGQSLVKTHVSEKEVNMGVLREKNMQNVYNKTMAMLFRGTKNLANNNAGMEVGQGVEARPSHDKVAYKQLSLTPLGGVTSSSEASHSHTCCSCVRADCAVGGRAMCGSCGGGVGARCVKTCEGCGAVACGVCDSVRPCHGCGAHYCGACALPSTLSDQSCVCRNCQM